MFAIATATDPEILIIDEVLGTGDGYFAWKASERMKKFCARGRALLYVSHSLASVMQMCDKVVWMQNGSVRMEGEASYVLGQYELDFRKSEDESLRRQQGNGKSRIAMAAPDELVETGQMRLRVVPKAGGHFFATHYVRSIRVGGIEPKLLEVPLELVDSSSPDVAAGLDLLSSEWGRMHERGGHECRALARTAGRNLGGQFVVGAKLAPSQLHLDFEVEVVASSTDAREKLTVEMLDSGDGTWKGLAEVEPSSVDREWIQQRFHGRYTAIDEKQAEYVKGTVGAAAASVAEILGIDLVSDGGQSLVVRECEPFEIQVRVRFNRSPQLADVGIKLTRMDGVYAFWQSSGMVGGNLKLPSGEHVVRFIFAENHLGAGDYFVNAHVSNGWQYPENYPYSRVFARVINGLTFRVMREMTEVDFGVLNQRVKVMVEECSR
jgi:lipopolysaccharide transport system ATP-binding protein